MKKINISILIACFIFLFLSCTSTQVTIFDELDRMEGTGPLKVVTEDNMIYTFKEFKYNDTAIYGTAKIVRKNIVREGKVVVNFNRIAHIEKYTFSGWKTIWVIAGSAAIVTYASSIKPDVFSIEEYYGGSSCPYVYSHDGADYYLEGEAFGISLGKQLESVTGIVFRYAKPVDNLLKVRITNERPESHFINSVQLLAAKKIGNKTLYPTNDNSFIYIDNFSKIDYGFKKSNDSLTQLISEIDGKYLESDLTNANFIGKFEDKFYLNVNKFLEKDSVSLVINAINTDISILAFEYIYNILGEEYPNFIKAADNDPEMYSILQKVLERAALKIDIWDGENWRFISQILPEASAVNFAKAVRIPVIENSVKIRLRALTDVWKIDAAFFDDSIPEYPEFRKCNLTNYLTDSHNGSDRNKITNDDNNHITLLPGNFLDLEFSVPANDYEYAILVKGYLYEWFIDNGIIAGEILSEANTNSPKLLAVKGILNNIDMILPIIYDKWKVVKEKKQFSNVGENK